MYKRYQCILGSSSQPNYKRIRELLRRHNGDPSTLLRRYPHFNPLGRLYDISTHVTNACEKGDISVLKGLVACGVDLKIELPDHTWALETACFWFDANGDYESTVEWILRQNPQDNATMLTRLNEEGESVLHFAIIEDEFELCCLLLKYGADPTVKTTGRTEDTALELAEERDMETKWITLLTHAEFSWRVMAIGGWRPWNASEFPYPFRVAMRTLVVLAKAQPRHKENTNTGGARYPQACLCLLPEELLQYLFVYITAPHTAHAWVERLWS